MADVELPIEYCDIVMKGGVTSGVIYPLTVAELAARFTLKSIAGTSAGAIAASLTAAAEYRRRHGSLQGFEILRQLPARLAAPGFLLSLFTADPPTRPLFRAVRSIAESGNPLQAGIRIWSALVAGYRKSTLIGALLGAVVPVALWFSGVAGTTAAAVLGAMWVLAGVTLSSLIAAAMTLPPLLQKNRFGLCSGFHRGHAVGGPPLVNWLYGLLNETAGLPASEPLTFRHLHDAPVCNDITGTERSINLEVMTTNLTHGRPHRLPFPPEEAATFYFAPEEWRDFFPGEVIEQLTRLPQDGGIRVATAEGLELYRIPEADLPVIVAVRMSLSFPGLFSAVPLWAVDFTRKQNQNLPRDAPRMAERCWFSDGGLTSNFPVHLFDAPLPRWPTFAINLKGPHPDFQNEEDFVWLPSTSGAGLQPRWNRFDSGPASRQIGGFVTALVDSMQSWHDNLAARMPGYRNRIVHVTLRRDEGGLNLSMPPDVIARLSDRGRRAGELLVSQFNFANHVWVRYRAYVAALWTHLRAFGDAYDHPMPQDETAWRFVKGEAPPPPFPSYRLAAADARELAELTATFAAAINAAEQPSAVDESPRPRPELRMTPRV
jgi:predicted acylesterase/phospholipase RssA